MNGRTKSGSRTFDHMAQDEIIAKREMSSNGSKIVNEGMAVLKKKHIVLMAICTGLIVANIYYCQPLIVLIGKGLGVAAPSAGRVVFFTQLGYALGLLFFVPLGDKLER